jgi:hypothetical protein
MSNHELLLYYGFSIDKNPKECIPITLDLEIPKEKLKLLDHLDLSLNHFLKFNIFPTKLLNTLKICFSTEKELKAFTSSDYDFSTLDSMENIQDCLDSIVELISSMKEMLQIEKEEKNLKFKQYYIYRMNLMEILESNLKFFQ